MSEYVPSRADIVWLDFTPNAGHEQANRRPALVLSRQSYNAASGLALLVPITAKAKGYRFEVPLREQFQTRGVILSDHVHSFDWRARNAEFIEVLPDALLDEVLARIAALLE